MVSVGSIKVGCIVNSTYQASPRAVLIDAITLTL
jgi:hypothetical protein